MPLSPTSLSEALLKHAPRDVSRMAIRLIAEVENLPPDVAVAILGGVFGAVSLRVPPERRPIFIEESMGTFRAGCARATVHAARLSPGVDFSKESP